MQWNIPPKQEVLSACIQFGDFPISVHGSELYKVAPRPLTDLARDEGGCLDEMVTSKIASVSADLRLKRDPRLRLARVCKIRQEGLKWSSLELFRSFRIGFGRGGKERYFTLFGSDLSSTNL